MERSFPEQPYWGGQLYHGGVAELPLYARHNGLLLAGVQLTQHQSAKSRLLSDHAVIPGWQPLESF